MSDIKFYNPNEIPYGILSNYAGYPIITQYQTINMIRVPKEQYKSVSHYIYGELSKSCKISKLISKSSNSDLIKNFNYLQFTCQKKIFENCLNNYIEALARQNEEFRKSLLLLDGYALNFKLPEGSKESVDFYNNLQRISEKTKQFIEHSKNIQLVNNFSFNLILNDLIKNKIVLNIYEKVRYSISLKQKQIIETSKLSHKQNLIFNTSRILYVLNDILLNDVNKLNINVFFGILSVDNYSDMLKVLEDLFSEYSLDYSVILEMYRYETLEFFKLISDFVDSKITFKQLMINFVDTIKPDFKKNIEYLIKDVIFNGYLISKLEIFNDQLNLSPEQFYTFFETIRYNYILNTGVTITNKSLLQFIQTIRSSYDEIYKLYKQSKLQNFQNFKIYPAGKQELENITISLDNLNLIETTFNTKYTEFIVKNMSTPEIESPKIVSPTFYGDIRKSEENTQQTSQPVLDTSSTISSDILPFVKSDDTEVDQKLEQILKVGSEQTSHILSTALKPAGIGLKRTKRGDQFNKGDYVIITGEYSHLTPGRIEDINPDGTYKVLYNYSESITEEQMRDQILDFSQENLLKIYEKPDRTDKKSKTIIIDSFYFFKNYYNCLNKKVPVLDDPFSDIEDNLNFLRMFEENVTINGYGYCDFASYYYHTLYKNYFDQTVCLNFENKYLNTNHFGKNANFWYLNSINTDFNNVRSKLAVNAIHKKFNNFKNRSILLSTGHNNLVYTDRQDRLFGLNDKEGDNFIGKTLMDLRNKYISRQLLTTSVLEQLLGQYSPESFINKSMDEKQISTVYRDNLMSNQLYKWLFNSRINDLVLTCKCLQLEFNYENLKEILNLIYYPCRFIDINFLYEIKMGHSFIQYTNIILNQNDIDFSNINLQIYQLLYTYSSNLIFNLYNQSYEKDFSNMINILNKKQEHLTNLIYNPVIIIECEDTHLQNDLNCILQSILNLSNIIQNGFDKKTKESIIFSYKIITKQYLTKIKDYIQSIIIPQNINITKLDSIIENSENRNLLIKCIFSIHKNYGDTTKNRINFMFNIQSSVNLTEDDHDDDDDDHLHEDDFNYPEQELIHEEDTYPDYEGEFE